MTGADQPSSPAEFEQLARALVETPGVQPTLRGVIDAAVRAVPCDWAAIAVTDVLTERPATLNASNDPALARLIGTISVEAGASPGIAAFEEAQETSCPDLAHEERFAAYADRMLERTPVRAVFSLPLILNGATTGVMSLYARRADAFDAEAVTRARVLAGHAVMAVEAARSEHAAENLEVALVHSRTIGAAIGILMERHKLTASAALDQLRTASQDSNRKLAELAAELVETGAIAGLDGLDGRPS